MNEVIPVAPTGLLPQSGPLLVVDNLTAQFSTQRGIVTAVNGVSFSLLRGKTLGIVGESGSGKSVLSRSIMGLLPRRITTTTGSVHYQDEVISSFTEKDYRRLWGPEMSMIFQDPMTALNPVKKIGAQIVEGIRHHFGISRGEASLQALALLQAVGIPEPERRMRAYPHELSGGMRQRVVIAIALACGPKLLFADEPTTALDVTVQAQVLDLLTRAQKERFMSMVLVTHDLGVVANRADDIAVMYAGKFVEKASAHTLFSSPAHPYTAALMNAIPRIDQPSHTRLNAIAGRPPDLAHLPDGCAFAPRCPGATDLCHQTVPVSQPVAGNPDHEVACHHPLTGSVNVAFPSQQSISEGYA